jgi:hypothetical protein
MLLLCALCLALGGCGSDSSTTVRVKVDNSIDDPDGDPNLIVDVIVIDDDDLSSAAISSGARLEGAVQGAETEPADPAPPAAELAYLALAADGNPRGIAVVDGTGEPVDWIESDSLDELSESTWSPDGARLVFADGDALHVAEIASGTTRRLVALPGASAVDWGPSLELESDGALETLEVIAAIGTDGAAGLEDVFAIYVDARGDVVGLENLTRTPDRRELDAAWLHDGARLALLERQDELDALVVREVVFGPRSAALASAESVLREAAAGTLGDVSAAHTSDQLAVSAWSGRSWDVLCVDARGNAARLGSAAIDESAPAWSHDDRLLAVERRSAASGGALPLVVWELGRPRAGGACPGIAGARQLGAAGALPAWRP